MLSSTPFSRCLLKAPHWESRFYALHRRCLDVSIGSQMHAAYSFSSRFFFPSPITLTFSLPFFCPSSQNPIPFSTIALRLVLLFCPCPWACGRVGVWALMGLQPPPPHFALFSLHHHPLRLSSSSLMQNTSNANTSTNPCVSPWTKKKHCSRRPSHFLVCC